MSINKPPVEVQQLPKTDEPSGRNVLVISHTKDRREFFMNELGSRFIVDTMTFDQLDDMPTCDVADILLLDTVSLPVSTKRVQQTIRAIGFEGPIGILSSSDEGENEGKMPNTEFVEALVRESELEDFVNRLIRRETYRVLLQHDFLVTHKLANIQVNCKNRSSLTNRHVNRLLEYKERLQDSLQDIQRDFDYDDYLALFEGGFEGRSSFS